MAGTRSKANAAGGKGAASEGKGAAKKEGLTKKQRNDAAATQAAAESGGGAATATAAKKKGAKEKTKPASKRKASAAPAEKEESKEESEDEEDTGVDTGSDDDVEVLTRPDKEARTGGKDSNMASLVEAFDNAENLTAADLPPGPAFVVKVDPSDFPKAGTVLPVTVRLAALPFPINLVRPPGKVSSKDPNAFVVITPGKGDKKAVYTLETNKALVELYKRETGEEEMPHDLLRAGARLPAHELHQLKDMGRRSTRSW